MWQANSKYNIFGFNCFLNSVLLKKQIEIFSMRSVFGVIFTQFLIIHLFFSVYFSRFMRNFLFFHSYSCITLKYMANLFEYRLFSYVAFEFAAVLGDCTVCILLISVLPHWQHFADFLPFVTLFSDKTTTSLIVLVVLVVSTTIISFFWSFWKFAFSTTFPLFDS